MREPRTVWHTHCQLQCDAHARTGIEDWIGHSCASCTTSDLVVDLGSLQGPLFEHLQMRLVLVVSFIVFLKHITFHLVSAAAPRDMSKDGHPEFQRCDRRGAQQRANGQCFRNLHLRGVTQRISVSAQKV
jgi:hypothetical protein